MCNPVRDLLADMGLANLAEPKRDSPRQWCEMIRLLLEQIETDICSIPDVPAKREQLLMDRLEMANKKLDLLQEATDDD